MMKIITIDGTKYFNTEAAAKELGKARKTVNSYIEQKLLIVRIINGKHYVPEAELMRFKKEYKGRERVAPKKPQKLTEKFYGEKEIDALMKWPEGKCSDLVKAGRIEGKEVAGVVIVTIEALNKYLEAQTRVRKFVISANVPEETYAEINRRAAGKSCTVSEYVRGLLTDACTGLF